MKTLSFLALVKRGDPHRTRLPSSRFPGPLISAPKCAHHVCDQVGEYQRDDGGHPHGRHARRREGTTKGGAKLYRNPLAENPGAGAGSECIHATGTPGPPELLPTAPGSPRGQRRQQGHQLRAGVLYKGGPRGGAGGVRSAPPAAAPRAGRGGAYLFSFLDSPTGANDDLVAALEGHHLRHAVGRTRVVDVPAGSSPEMARRPTAGRGPMPPLPRPLPIGPLTARAPTDTDGRVTSAPRPAREFPNVGGNAK